MRNNDENVTAPLRGTAGFLCCVLTLLVCFGATPPASAQEAATSPTASTNSETIPQTAEPSPAKTKSKAIQARKNTPALSIQDFRIGMTAPEVKQLLLKKNIRNYDTGFSDVFAYNPSPGTEIRLLLACAAKGNVLGKVELTMPFTTEENAIAIPKIKEKLIARYGMPVFMGPQGDLDFCWGQCDQGAAGVKLTALATPPQGNKRTFALTLGNESLFQACSAQRPKTINSWLYQWIAAVQKFKIGMSSNDAAQWYRKRFQNNMELEEERDEESPHYAVINYVSKDYDFFASLDYDSQAFDGIDLGTIILKFTGDQAGKSTLNRKLYYTLFSTTKFSDQHAYPDVKQKLDQFIKAYGMPLEVVPQPDGITARWQQGSQQRSVSIYDSGLITFEQSDPALKDAYRESAVKKIEEFTKTRFDNPAF